MAASAPSAGGVGFVPIVTPRLILRRLTATDAPIVAAYRGDPAIARYQAWAAGDAEPALLADWFTQHGGDQADTADGPGLLVAIVRRDDGVMVGDCSLQVRAADLTVDRGGARDRPRPHPRVGEVGYSLAPAHHRQGYATEAAAWLCGWAMAAHDLAAIVAQVDHRNRPSIAVLERLGMVAVAGVTTKLRGEVTVMVWFERAR